VSALKIPGTTGFVVKSSKTSDDFEARRFAEDLYYQLEGRARRGESIKSPTFKRVFEEWKASLSAELAVGSTRYASGNIRRMELWALPFLGSLSINTINENVLSDHLQWRVKQASKPPAVSTLRNERSVLNQIFRFAKRKGYVGDPPTISVPSWRQNARPDISEDEWRTLYKYLRRYIKEAQDKRRHRERFYLQHYILILANSGIRLGEARQLRWRDVSSTKTPPMATPTPSARHWRAAQKHCSPSQSTLRRSEARSTRGSNGRRNCASYAPVHMSPSGTKLTSDDVRSLVAVGLKADIREWAEIGVIDPERKSVLSKCASFALLLSLGWVACTDAKLSVLLRVLRLCGPWRAVHRL
jgi:hypothetical protein